MHSVSKKDVLKGKIYEGQYDEMLNQAENKHEDKPANDYYKDGYYLYRRLKKYKKLN